MEQLYNGSRRIRKRMANGGERANTTSYEEKRQHASSHPALEMPRRILRSDTARAYSRLDDEDMREASLEENEDDLNAATQQYGGQQQKKRGRCYTRKANIRSRGNQPPIRLEINEKGQPVGDNATEFANFVATLVKNSEIVSLAKPDWRLVEPRQKLLLWNTLKLYYEIAERVKDWVMGSAAKKWRDFKSDLKALYFHEENTEEELLADCDDRVHEDDWKWLIDHWRTNAAKYIDDEGENSKAGYRAAEKEDDQVMYVSKRQMIENRAKITQQKKQVLVQQMNQQDHQNTSVTQKTPQVGQDVTLYSISRPYNIRLAKATIQSIDRTEIVVGAELGSQCCEVVANMVMKKDAILQRHYGNVRTMANALKRSIAWPRRYIEVIRKAMQKKP